MIWFSITFFCADLQCPNVPFVQDGMGAREPNENMLNINVNTYRLFGWFGYIVDGCSSFKLVFWRLKSQTHAVPQRSKHIWNYLHMSPIMSYVHCMNVSSRVPLLIPSKVAGTNPKTRGGFKQYLGALLGGIGAWACVFFIGCVETSPGSFCVNIFSVWSQLRTISMLDAILWGVIYEWTGWTRFVHERMIRQSVVSVFLGANTFATQYNYLSNEHKL